jgi:hypothetical protein
VLAPWLRALPAGDAAAFRCVLSLRFLLLNLVAVALLAAVWLRGWSTPWLPTFPVPVTVVTSVKTPARDGARQLLASKAS